MRVMFTSTWGVGHVFPMVPLARAWVAAGHEVCWVTSADTCPLVAAAGLDTRPGGIAGAALGDVRRRLVEGTAELPGPEKAAFAFPNMFGAWATPPMLDDLLPLARSWQPDLLIHEPAELAAPLAAAVLGVRCITHSWGGAVPAPMLAAAAEVLGPVWTAHRLTVPPYAGVGASGYLDLCPPEVQPVSVEHFTGRRPLRPVVYSGERTGSPAPYLTTGDDRPLVYLTFGTVLELAPVLATAVEGIAALGVRVLVTVGPRGDPSVLGPLPDSVHVERWVSQADVLPRVAAVVSHAGSGTVLGALGHGVPQVFLPQAADQFRTAAAATAVGAAVTVLPGDATAGAIETAVRRVLTEPGFRDAATRVSSDIARMPAPAEVVAALQA